jgi:hypothetical protein
MTDQFLISPPESNSGASREAPPSLMKRRTFIRRTGAATVSTFVAMQLSKTAWATVTNDNSASGAIHRIRPAGPTPAVTEVSTGMAEWSNEVNDYIQKTRTVTIEGTDNQTWGLSATNTVTITMELGANVQDANGEYVPATDSQLQQLFPAYSLTDRKRPSVKRTATITKTIRERTGEVISTTFTFEGKSPGQSGYDETGAPDGMTYNVDFDFTGGNDNVTVNHGGGGPGGNTTTFNAAFEIKRFTSPPQ